MNVFFNALSYVFFAAVPLLFLLTLLCGIRQWQKNNRSPRLEVAAMVAGKRQEDIPQPPQPVAGDASGAHGFIYPPPVIQCYAVFRVASGDTLEFQVSDQVYSGLREGDRGTLRFQGTRYQDFTPEA